MWQMDCVIVVNCRSTSERLWHFTKMYSSSSYHCLIFLQILMCSVCTSTGSIAETMLCFVESKTAAFATVCLLLPGSFTCGNQVIGQLGKLFFIWGYAMYSLSASWCPCAWIAALSWHNVLLAPTASPCCWCSWLALLVHQSWGKRVLLPEGRTLLCKQ